MAGKPIADKGTNCPLYKQDVSKCCHKCAWYILVRGKHPQSEEMIDAWGCAMSFLPMLMVENSQQQRSTGQAVESFRNEIVKAGQQVIAGMTQRPQLR